MSDSTGPFDLARTPIHLGSRAVPQHGFGFDGPSFEAYIGRHCSPGDPARLVMIETTPADWATWERHAQGDEVVIVLEGRGEFIQEIDGEQQRVRVGPGSTLINPIGVWHTADVEEPIKAIYLTPCPGTERRAR